MWSGGLLGPSREFARAPSLSPSLPQTQARAPGAERRGGVYGAASVTLTVSQRRIDFRHGGECEAQTGREAPAAAARDDQPARQPEMLRL